MKTLDELKAVYEATKKVTDWFIERNGGSEIIRAERLAAAAVIAALESALSCSECGGTGRPVFASLDPCPACTLIRESIRRKK